VNIGKPKTSPAPRTLKLSGMEQSPPLQQRYLHLVVQQIAPGTFVHLESGINLQIIIALRQGDNFIVNFIMKQFLVRGHVLLVRLRLHQKTMPLLVVLFKRTVAAFV